MPSYNIFLSIIWDSSLLIVIDRKIEFPLPDRRQKRLIFSTITGKMNLSEEVDLEDFVAR